MSKGIVHFSSESQKSTQEIADFLRLVADKLAQEGAFYITQGEQEFEIRPEGKTKLELKYETKGEKQKFEIEIEWNPAQSNENVIIK